MAQEPDERSSQPHSLVSNPQVLPPVVSPVPHIISPLIVETHDPKLRRRLRFALVSAVLIDCIQISLFPLFSPGFLSVANDLLDCFAFLFFWRLIGWHWALLPGLVFEFLPFVDLAPTWTLAVCIAVRSQTKAGAGLKSSGAV